MKREKFGVKRIKDILSRDWLPLLILILYPMRHVNWGLDLWDTGYNYANFQYMGLDHMDSMWLYSTYLANVVGNFLTKLPFGDCLVGMNVYTGLFASLLGVLGYWFCTRRLRMPRWIVFLGEMIALSLCWCPTALLYNYLTYVLFTLCVILLYLGLTKNNMRYLFLAGTCLGANVLVRFSNLPEAALILAVWAYAVLEELEERKQSASRQGSSTRKHTPQEPDSGIQKHIPQEPDSGIQKHTPQEPDSGARKHTLQRLSRYTLWCLGGYLTALALLLGYIHIRYGLPNYLAGILRLFAMTDNNADYKPTAMIMGIVGEYVRNLYWVVRLAAIAAVGMLGFGTVKTILTTEKMKSLRAGSPQWEMLCRLVELALLAACGLLALVSVGWLYYRGFCSFAFYSYDSMLRPGILFLMLTMGIAGVRIVHPACPKEEKLLGGLLILVVLLTSIGSNNGVYPSINHLFLAAPYTLWQCWRFFIGGKEFGIPLPAGKRRKLCTLVISPLPAKAVLAAFLALCLFQFTGFGANFAFAESTGIQQPTAQVENNEILKGVKMHPDKARWLTELSAYVQEAGLTGREVILYGDIPALSYYLGMPSAFNPWSDLASYRPEVFEQELKAAGGLETAGQEKVAEGLEAVEASKATGELAAAADTRPVIILENRYVQYLRGGETALEDMGLSEVQRQKITGDEKWKALAEFLEEYGYEETFSNEKFGVYE